MEIRLLHVYYVQYEAVKDKRNQYIPIIARNLINTGSLNQSLSFKTVGYACSNLRIHTTYT